MDYPWAVPGAKVVCVVPIGPSQKPHPSNISIGEVLAIAEVDTSPLVKSGVILRFSERPVDCWYTVTAFKPLITQSDDVAKFTHLLTPQKIEERV